MEELHGNFSANECGFFISLTVPYMGASPDALVSWIVVVMAVCGNCCGNCCLW